MLLFKQQYIHRRWKGLWMLDTLFKNGVCVCVLHTGIGKGDKLPGTLLKRGWLCTTQSKQSAGAYLP